MTTLGEDRNPCEAGSEPAEDSDEAVVDVKPVPATDQGHAFLFNPNTGFLLVADHKVMDLQEGLVDEPQSLLDGPFVDFDDQTAQELVVVILQVVFFGVSNFDSELHRYGAFKPRVAYNRGMDRAIRAGGRKFGGLAALFAKDVSLPSSGVENWFSWL